MFIKHWFSLDSLAKIRIMLYRKMWKIRSTSYLGDLTSGTVTGKYLEQETKHLTFSSLNIAEDKLYYNSVLLQNETDKRN